LRILIISLIFHPFTSNSHTMSIRDSVTSNRDSIASTTSRFSSLLTPSSNTHSTSRPSSSLSYHPPQPSSFSGTSTPQASVIPPSSKRTSIIYDRSLNKPKSTSNSTSLSTTGTSGGVGEVSLGAWMFLFGEIVQYTQKQVSGISEFEKR